MNLQSSGLSVSLWIWRLASKRIPFMEIRRSHDRLTCIMEMLIHETNRLYIGAGTSILPMSILSPSSDGGTIVIQNDTIVSFLFFSIKHVILLWYSKYYLCCITWNRQFGMCSLSHIHAVKIMITACVPRNIQWFSANSKDSLFKYIRSVSAQ